MTRGLAGMFIVDDDNDVRLPKAYGVDDLPVIVQDRSFGGDGEFNTRDRGDTLLVNGTLAPYFDVTTEKVRLRLLNGSTARVYDFGLSDDRSFAMVASDGGLLEQPFAAKRIRLSPGERAEIIVAFRPGETTVLRSFGPDLGDNFFADVFGGGRDQFDVLELRAAARLAPSPDVPARLATIDRLDPANAAQTRNFRLTGTNINGDEMDMNRVDEVVTVDTTEVWEVSNQDGQIHSFHVHDVQFQVLSVDGRAPDASLRGLEGHHLRQAEHDGAHHPAVRRLHRPRHAVHVPLPPAHARGQRDDGPVRGRRARAARHGAAADDRPRP